MVTDKNVNIGTRKSSVDEKAMDPGMFPFDAFNATTPTASPPYLEIQDPWVLTSATLLTASNWQYYLLMTSAPFTPRPWNKSACARIGTSLDSGTADGDVACQLVDSGAEWDGIITAGDIVYNSTDDVYATVLVVLSDTELWLDWDAFPDGDEDYTIYDEPSPGSQFAENTGSLLDGDGTVAADTDTANHLLDADGTDWTTIVSVGDWVWNLQTGLVAYVTAVGAHDLTLSWDCFPNGDEPYLIFSNRIEVTDTDSPLYGQYIRDMNISNRIVGAGLTGERALLDAGQGFQVGADETLDAVAGPYWATAGLDGETTSHGPTANRTYPIFSKVDFQGDATMIKAVNDGTHGDIRSGPWTSQKRIEQVMITRIK
jgi:hypothetical protein